MRRFLVLVALVVIGCGSAGPTLAPGQTATPTPAPTATPRPTPTPTLPPVTMTDDCVDEAGGLYEALADLDARLNVGLNFRDYGERVGDAMVAYQRIDIEDLDPLCLTEAGVRLENALNEYTQANSKWSECITDTDCDIDRRMPRLQEHWAKASELIEEVEDIWP